MNAVSTICALCFLYLSAVLCQSHPYVETSLGKIKGSYLSSYSKREFLSFRGIRYAKPPIGQLRFQDPVPVDPWAGVLDATREGPTCVQFDPIRHRVKGTEDCLALNVYTQTLRPDDGLRPVMVWIHGGGFTMGSGNGENYLYGPKYFMNKDIVLVTVNYRLSTFGFYSTESDKAPGNYGLLDQTLALKWVRDHIHHFGGNPESVTIFGESAGGASVHYHILSPHSKGLFHRAIAQSGTSLCPWAMSETMSKQSILLAERTNCLRNTPEEQLECLRSKKAEELVAMPERGAFPDKDFGPRIDTERSNPFLPAHPIKILENGEYNQVPLIAGVTENEGLVYLGTAGLLSSTDKTRQFDERPIHFLKKLLNIPFNENADEISSRAKKHYLEDVSVVEQLGALEKMVSDFNFFKCVDNVVSFELSRDKEPVYYYLYTHHGQYKLPQLFSGATKDYGVSHGDELFLMFSSFLPPSFVPKDKKMSKILIDLWTSFAGQGVPVSEDAAVWLPTSKDAPRYLNISVEPQMVTGQMPFHHRLQFWDRLLINSTGKDEL